MFGKSLTKSLALVAILTASLSSVAYAAEPLSITITPPLIDIEIAPGNNWQSQLKLINNNDYEATFYATLADFESEDENGHSRFHPVIGSLEAESHTHSLASWISLEMATVTIPAGGVKQLPFSIKVPADAEPGGHYASILVGANQGSVSGDGTQMSINTQVASLILARVTGEVIEEGSIRSFHSDKMFYQTPTADFVMRFENTGNVHLRPRGIITITNMWGTERGSLTVNQNGLFGNVLPDSTRNFTFNWSGDAGIWDIGRYTAVVTLNYGEDGKKNVTAETYFYVVPVVPVAITLSILVSLLLAFSWFTRLYIRRAISLERRRIGGDESVSIADNTPVPTPSLSLETLVLPIKTGVVDLRRATGRANTKDNFVEATMRENSMDLGKFIRNYRVFFVFLLFFVIGVGLIFWYAINVTNKEHNFDIKAEQGEDQ